jgi:hypothetical protein
MAKAMMKMLHSKMASMHWKHQDIEPSFGIGNYLMLRRPEMTRLAVLAAAMAAAVSFAPLAATAQRAGALGAPHLHAVNPSLSLSTRSTSPLQQQIQQDYRTSLLSAQRDLSQSNPSGLSRQQISIGHQLDDYNSMPPR